jgi:hypothetical protein
LGVHTPVSELHEHWSVNQVSEEKSMNPDNCTLCGVNSVRNMHSDDRELERKAKAEGRRGVAAFFARHEAKFKALVSTYADAQAVAKLEALRELFWTALPAGSRNTLFGAPRKRKAKAKPKTAARRGQRSK